jgi:hypothetical protein
MNTEKHVALFIGNYGLGTSSQLWYLAKSLADRGFLVDVFHFGMKYTHCVNFGHSVILHPLLSSGGRFRSWWQKLLPFKNSRFEFLKKSVVARARKTILKGQTVLAIGIDTYGIVLAGAATDGLAIPLVYYSLELRYSTSPLYIRDSTFAQLKSLERKVHRICRGTLIQSKERARILFEDNQLPQENIWILPVSIGEPAATQKTNFLQKRFCLPKSQINLLQLGFIGERSHSYEIAKAALSFPANWSTIFNGPFQQTHNFMERMEEIKSSAPANQICLSPQLANLSELANLICSAHIGIVAYKAADLNEVHVLYASEKLARYLHCGLPFVGIGVLGLKELLEEYPCGVAIDDISQMEEAVHFLLDHYEDYRKNAFYLFEQKFEFNKCIAPFLESLDGYHCEPTEKSG